MKLMIIFFLLNYEIISRSFRVGNIRINGKGFLEGNRNSC